ncbi:KRR1 family protein [Cryptosporidium andersoni]|uniref:KRR1 family protein n=1 Tax=Cryptosporidium andersoni TaxID=117008 RepID=A0A1J4MUJ2_9CRYT|nr:KRR1 family protein [Cryptosporidium andersoni]
MDLLDSGNCSEDNLTTLKVNEDYKKKYDEKKRKEALAKAKDLLAKTAEDFSESDTSSSDEDEYGELLKPNIQIKILDTLCRIKKRDPSIYDHKNIIFSDSDDDSTEVEKIDKKKKPYLYKDYEREAILEEMNESEEKQRKVRKLEYNREQEEIKQAFLEAAKGLDNEDEGSEELLVQRKGTQDKEMSEGMNSAYFVSTNTEMKDPMETLNRYWGPEEELDENEKFLRNFILKEEWKDFNNQECLNNEKIFDINIEKEDEEHCEIAEQFEHIYNFRYEEPDLGTQIQGYTRNIPSLRKVDDRRKQKRLEKKERKTQEKLVMAEELKQLKNWKKQEIFEKIKKIREISDNKNITDEVLDLESEFDPIKHDQQMAKLFDSDYNSNQEVLSLEELLNNDIEEHDKNTMETKIQNVVGNFSEHNIGKEFEKRIEDDLNDKYEWWQCDQCLRGIPPGNKKFDCTICENYTLCKMCCKIVNHQHLLKKNKVPKHANLPEGITNLSRGMTDTVEKLMDEYYGLDYEDIIGGDLRVRFKYSKVDKEDFGITLNELLELDDKELNRRVSLKALAPYRENINRYIRDFKNGNKSSFKLAQKNKKLKTGHILPSNVNIHRLEAYGISFEDTKGPKKNKQKRSG